MPVSKPHPCKSLHGDYDGTIKRPLLGNCEAAVESTPRQGSEKQNILHLCNFVTLTGTTAPKQVFCFSFFVF